MNIIKKLIEEARKEYEKEAQKTTIELLYITKAIRKGSMKNGTN